MKVWDKKKAANGSFFFIYNILIIALLKYTLQQ